MRKILRFPAENLRSALDKSAKDLGNRHDEAVKLRSDSERAATFFHELVTRSQTERTRIEGVELESPPARMDQAHL